MSLKDARQSVGLTQRQLAEAAKVSIAAYQRYENQRQTPSAQAAIRIADTLGTTVEALFHKTAQGGPHE